MLCTGGWQCFALIVVWEAGCDLYAGGWQWSVLVWEAGCDLCAGAGGETTALLRADTPMDVVPLDEIRTTYACGVCGSAPCVFLVSEIDEILSDPRVHNAQQVREIGMPRDALPLIEHRAHGRAPPDSAGTDREVLSLHEIRTSYRCQECGEVGCRFLLAALQVALDDPDMGRHIRQPPEGVPRRGVDEMARRAHEAVAGREDGERPADAASMLKEYAPWRLDNLRKFFGSTKLDELAESTNETDERRRIAALMRADGDIQMAATLLESEGEHRAAAIASGVVEKVPHGCASPSLCEAVMRGDTLKAQEHLTRDSQSASLLFIDEHTVKPDDNWELLRVAAVEGHAEMCK